MAKLLSEEQKQYIDQLVREAWYDNIKNALKQSGNDLNRSVDKSTGDAQNDKDKKNLEDYYANYYRNMAKSSANPSAFSKALTWLDKKYNQGRLTDHQNKRMNQQMQRDYLPPKRANMTNYQRKNLGEIKKMWEERLFDYWCKNNSSFISRIPSGKRQGRNLGIDAASEWREYFASATHYPQYSNPELDEYIVRMVNSNPYSLPNLTYSSFVKWNKRKNRNKGRNRYNRRNKQPQNG